MSKTTRTITEIDVLIHHAKIASSKYYIAGERIFPAPQPTNTKRKPHTDSTAPTKRRRLSHAKLESKSQSQALWTEDEILEQLDEDARRDGLDPLAIRDEMTISTAQTLSNILPPPPPLDPDRIPTASPISEDPPSTDPRPRWNFTTTPLPPHLKRQVQLHSPAAPSTISEEDVSEVDELATPGDKGSVTADTSGEAGSPGGKLKHAEAGGTLLSLPRRLWSSIRPGLTL